MENQTRCIILVDDEQNILLALKRELHEWARETGLEILTCLSAREALKLLEARAADTVLVVSDLKMPEMKGSDFLLEVKKLYPDIVSLLLTGFSETEEIVKAVRAGIFSYMLKPWDSDYLLTEITKAYSFSEMRRQNETYIKRVEEELRWAGEMQKAILRPNVPASPGVEFRVTYRPVPGLYCGGDYYDVIPVGTDRYLLLIGDVSGHGVKAAFVTGILKAVIYPEYVRGIIGKTISPADFLGWLNSRMQFEFRSTTAMLISFFAGVLDMKARTFVYANAGHNHPFILRDGVPEELLVSGPAIGSGRNVLFMEQQAVFRSGNVFMLYTDGLAEVGKGVSVAQLLQEIPYGTDYHLRLLEGALARSGVTAFADDVAIVTARIE
jgi:sigma-B regulation protein RsbU (phosphoserine phosphatase)